MGIRESLNRKPGVAAGIAGGAAVLAVVLIVAQLRGNRPAGLDRAFFTIDDGQTWFSDDVTKLAPFQRDGKEAVRAYVFECDGKEFVNHLERFTPEGRKLMEQTLAAEQAGKPPPVPPAVGGQSANWGMEVKRPGDKQWTSASNLAKSSAIFQPKCPGGGAGTPQLVAP